jgi:hypothetical protein
MQNSGYGNPAVQERVETIPSHAGALTATDQYPPPQPTNTMHEDAQLIRVTRNGMVLVITQHNLAKPHTNLGRTMMLPASKFSLGWLSASRPSASSP